MEVIEELTNEERGALLMMMFEYSMTGTYNEATDRIVQIAFKPIKAQMDRDMEKYQKVCERNKANIAKRYSTDNKSVPEATSGIPDDTKSTDVCSMKNDVCSMKNDKEIKETRAKRFIPPSVEDVKDYCKKQGYQVDADRFIDFYESKGWMVGSNKMKDWKAAVRNWSRSQRQESTAKVKKTAFSNAPERDYDMSDLARQLIE